MESSLDLLIDEISQSPDFQGCVFVDRNGLCLGNHGNTTSQSSGIIAAIAEQAAKLETVGNKHPVINIESESKCCVIQRVDGISAAIYKKNSAR